MFNNKSQAIFVGIMVAMMVFIVIVQLIGPLKTQIMEMTMMEKIEKRKLLIITKVIMMNNYT